MIRADLSVGTRVSDHEAHRCIFVGWIDSEDDFEPRPPNRSSLETLMLLLSDGDQFLRNRVRSVRYCPICHGQIFLAENFSTLVCGNDATIQVVREAYRARGVPIRLVGSSEMWLPSSEDRETFIVAPSLIVHYVADHGYQPPPEFWRAVDRAAGL